MAADPDTAHLAAAAAREAGNVPVELLGDFPAALAAAVRRGTALTPAQLRPYRRLGEDAAHQGVALRVLLDLYLSAARLLWPQLPTSSDSVAVVTAGEIVLRAVDEVVGTLAEAYQLARRSVIRAEASARREFVDDLLAGSADVAGLMHRATGFGLDLAGPHAVLVVQTERDLDDSAPVLAALERAVLGRKGDAHALVASKDARVVLVFAAPDRAAVDHVVEQVQATLAAPRTGKELGAVRIGLGRGAIGPAGVLGAYRGARDALDLGRRLRIDATVLDAADLRAFRLLLRDQSALRALVEDTLGPLRDARAGADALVATLATYFRLGGNVTATARELHLSVRAVAYRLARIRELTGLDPDAAEHRYTLQTAALGAQLLDWTQPTPSADK